MQNGNETSIDNEIITDNFFHKKLGNKKYFLLKVKRFFYNIGRLFKSCIALYFEQWKKALISIGDLFIGHGCSDYTLILRILGSIIKLSFLVFIRACPVLIILSLFTDMFPMASVIAFAIVAFGDFGQVILFAYNRCPDREYEDRYYSCNNPECQNANSKAYYSEVSGCNVTIHLNNNVHFHGQQVDSAHRVDKFVVYNQINQIELKEHNIIPHSDYNDCRVKTGVRIIN